MATEERVVLVAQLQDELSAPLQQAEQALGQVTQATERAQGANGRYVRSAQETTRTTTRARDENGRFTRAMSQVTGETDRSTGGMGRFRRAVQQVTDGARNAGGAIRSGLSRPLSVAGDAAKSFAGSAVKTIGLIGGALGGIALAGGIARSLNIEGAQAKLKGLGHSAESVEQIMANASASVTGTAFGLGDAAGVAAGAVAAGIKPGKDLERVLKLVGDGATIAGMEMGQMGGIFNKVAASGKLQGDVIQSLQDSGVPILQLVAKELGVTAEEAQKMASEGKVSFETFTQAMEAGMGGAALKSGETFKGAMANTKAALGRIGETLATPFLDSIKAVFNTVMPIFDSINAALKPVMERFGKRLDAMTPKFAKWGAGITGIVDLLRGDFTGALREAFGWEEDSGIVDYILRLRENVGGFIGEIKPLLGPIVGALLAMVTTFGSLIPVVGQFLPVINPVVGLLIGLIATSPELRSALGDAFQSLLPIFEQVAITLGDILPVLADLLTMGVEAVAWIIDTLNPALPVLVPLVLGLVLAFKAAQVGMVLWKGATSAWLAIQAGYQTALGIGTGLTHAQASATERGTRGFILMKATQYGMVAAMAVVTAAQWAWNAALNANPIGIIVLAIAALVGGLIWAYNNVEWFRDGVDAALAWVVDAFHNVVAWLGSIFGPAIAAIGDFFTTVFTAVIDWWNSVFMPAIFAIGDWFADAFTTVSDIIGGVGQWFVDAWDNIVGFSQDFVTGFLAVLGTIGQWFADVFGPAINGLVGFFRPVFEWIQRYVWNAMTIIMTIFYALVDLWNGVLFPALQGLAGWFGDVLGWIGDRIRDYVGMWIDFFGMIIDWWNNTLVPIFETVGLAFELIMGWIGNKIDLAVFAWQLAFTMIVDWWNTTLVPVFEAAGAAMGIILAWIGDAISWYVGLWIGFFGMLVDWWNNTLIPAVQAIGDFFASVFNWIYDGIIAPVIGFIVGKFNELLEFWNTVLSPAIDMVASWFSDKISSAIDGVTGFIDKLRFGFDVFILFWTEKLKPIVDAIVAAFDRVAGAVGAAIGKVKEVAGGALDTGKDFLSNPLGGVQDWMGIEKDGNGQGVMPTRNSGGGVYGFDGGGVLGGYAPGVDNILALLSPGESVLVPEATRAIGPSNIMAINHAFSGGRPAGAGPARASLSAPTGSGGGAGVMVAEGAVQITVVAQPGQTNEDIGQAVADAVNEVFEEMKRRGY